MDLLLNRANEGEHRRLGVNGNLQSCCRNQGTGPVPVILHHTETKYVSIAVTSADSVSKAAAKLFGTLSISVVSSEIIVGSDNVLELKYVVCTGKTSEVFDYAVNKLRMTDDVISVHVE